MKRTVFASLFFVGFGALQGHAQGADHPLVASANAQIGVTVIYDPAYVGLEYPGGDVPMERGVCTDVIIRAMRDAWDLDLQQIVHRDMKANFSSYPKNWGLSTTDRNIDHRRVPNLETLFNRSGASLELSSDPTAFESGDIVSFRLTGTNLPHIGIVTDEISANGVPLITHNIGWGTRTDDILFDHKLVGHFRLNQSSRDWLASR